MGSTEFLPGPQGEADKAFLSICIPIYNFGDFIGPTLDSIVDQAERDVEIVILDGGSTDATDSVVNRYRQRYPSIKYIRLEKPGGIDADMAKVIDLASGEYCWLFSGDDIMDAGAISRLRVHLESKPDVIVCTHRECLKDMTVVHERHPVLAVDDVTTFELGNPADRRRYFELARSSEAFFSFMSGLVVRRQTWVEAPSDQRFMGTCWAHAARLLSLMRSRLRVKFLPVPMLSRRGENDSFAGRGVVKRYAIAIDGFHDIAEALFGKHSSEAFHTRRVIRNEITLLCLINAKLACRLEPEREDLSHLTALARRSYSDPSLGNASRLFVYNYVPLPLFKLAQRLWRKSRARRVARREVAA